MALSTEERQDIIEHSKGSDVSEKSPERSTQSRVSTTSAICSPKRKARRADTQVSTHAQHSNEQIDDPAQSVRSNKRTVMSTPTANKTYLVLRHA